MRRQELFTVSLLTALVFSPGHGWAAPSVTSFTGNPTLFPPRVQTKVNLTVAVSNPTFITSSAQLQRQQVDGSWKNTDKVVFSPTLNPRDFFVINRSR